MHEVLRDRIWRKLEVLPEPQLYEVLDYIEFLESKYAAQRARQPDALQRFAERLEDGMRIRSVAPKVISGTVGVLGTARKVLRTVQDAGRDILNPPAETPVAPRAAAPRIVPGRNPAVRSAPPAAPRNGQSSDPEGPGGGESGPGGARP